MRDDFLSRDWADQHRNFSRDINKLFRTIGVSMARLNALQFDAPWRNRIDRDCKPAPRQR